MRRAPSTSSVFSLSLAQTFFRRRGLALCLFLISILLLAGCSPFEDTADYPFPEDTVSASDTFGSSDFGDTSSVNEDSTGGDSSESDTGGGADTTGDTSIDIIPLPPCDEPETRRVYLAPKFEGREEVGSANCPFNKLSDVIAEVERRAELGDLGLNGFEIFVSERSREDSIDHPFDGENFSTFLSTYPGIHLIGGHPFRGNGEIDWNSENRTTTWVTVTPIIFSDGISSTGSVGMYYSPSHLNSSETRIENFSWRVEAGEVPDNFVWGVFAGSLKMKNNVLELNPDATIFSAGIFNGQTDDTLDLTPPDLYLSNLRIEAPEGALFSSCTGIFAGGGNLVLSRSNIQLPDHVPGGDGDSSAGVVVGIGERTVPIVEIEYSKIQTGKNYMRSIGIAAEGLSSVTLFDSSVIAQKVINEVAENFISVGVLASGEVELKILDSAVYALGGGGIGVGVLLENPWDTQIVGSTINYAHGAQNSELKCTGFACIGVLTTGENESFTNPTLNEDWSSAREERGFSCCDPAIFPVTIEDSALMGGSGFLNTALAFQGLNGGSAPETCIDRSYLDGGDCFSNGDSFAGVCDGIQTEGGAEIRLQNSVVVGGKLGGSGVANALHIKSGGHIEASNNLLFGGKNTGGEPGGAGGTGGVSISALHLEQLFDDPSGSALFLINNIIDPGEGANATLITRGGEEGTVDPFIVLFQNNTIPLGGMDVLFPISSGGLELFSNEEGFCLNPTLRPQIPTPSSNSPLRIGDFVFPAEDSIHPDFDTACESLGSDFNASNNCIACSTPQIDLQGHPRLTLPRNEVCEEVEITSYPSGGDSGIDIGPLQLFFP